MESDLASEVKMALKTVVMNLGTILNEAGASFTLESDVVRCVNEGFKPLLDRLEQSVQS